VTFLGQLITFKLVGLPGLFQWQFNVKAIRLDYDAKTLAAKTVNPNHPLVGWRYWRVFELEPGTVVVETGAVDKPAPWGQLGYYIDRYIKGAQLKIWKTHLQHIAIETGLPYWLPPEYDHPEGVWDDTKKGYIMSNVCGPDYGSTCP